MRAKVKRLRIYTIVVTKDIPISFETSDKCRLAGKACREDIERELGKRALEFANIKVDWYARKAAAKIRVLDCKEM